MQLGRNKYMKQILLINLCLLLSIISLNNAYSQSINTKIASYLKLISEGRSDEVKNKLTDLTTNYPDEPGVLLLQGALQKNIVKPGLLGTKHIIHLITRRIVCYT